jgi:hypothetical protein
MNNAITVREYYHYLQSQYDNINYQLLDDENKKKADKIRTLITSTLNLPDYILDSSLLRENSEANAELIAEIRTLSKRKNFLLEILNQIESFFNANQKTIRMYAAVAAAILLVLGLFQVNFFGVLLSGESVGSQLIGSAGNLNPLPSNAASPTEAIDIGNLSAWVIMLLVFFCSIFGMTWVIGSDK